MREKIFNVIHKIYGILMTVSFFAGILPLIPFAVALCIGGETGNAIAVFLMMNITNGSSWAPLCLCSWVLWACMSPVKKACP